MASVFLQRRAQEQRERRSGGTAAIAAPAPASRASGFLQRKAQEQREGRAERLPAADAASGGKQGRADISGEAWTRAGAGQTVIPQQREAGTTYSQRYASRQAESIRKSLESGKLSDGRAVTPVIRETLEKSLADYEAQEQDPNRGFFTRFGNMTKGGAKGSLSGNMDLMGIAYQVGQGSRTGQNQELAGEYGRGLERARGDLDAMLADNAQSAGTWGERDVEAQRNIVADWQRKYDAASKVLEEHVQERAGEGARDLAWEVGRSGAADIDRAKEGQGKLQNILVDAGASLVQVAGDAAGGALLGTTGMLPFAARALGGGTQQARENGADLSQQLLYGGAIAAKEVFTERMFNLALPFSRAYGGGALDKLVKRGIRTAVDKFARTDAGKKLLGGGLTWMASALSEGAEEFIGDWMEWQMPRIYGGEPETAEATLSNAVYDFLVGAAAGGIGSAASPGTYRYGTEEAQAEEGGVLDEAARQLAAEGRVSSAAVTRIPADETAMERLGETAGLTVDGAMSKSQRRAAVKDAVAGLAGRGDGTAEEARGIVQAGAQDVIRQSPAPAAPQNNVQRIQQAAQVFGKNGAEAAVNLYDGTADPAAYYGGFAAYYQAGLTGTDAGKVRSPYAGALNEAQRQAAYLAGQGDAKKAASEMETEIVVRSGKSALDNPKGLAYTLASNMKKISDMAPVVALTGREMNDRTMKPSEQIMSFFKRVGGKVFRKGFGEVSLGEYGVSSMINHRPLNRAKMVSLVAVPDVIREGREISRVENWKGRGYTSIVFAAPVTIHGIPTYIAAVVDQRPDNKFYLSECVDSEGNYVRIDESPSDSTKSGVTEQAGVTTGPERLSEDSIRQAERGVNGEELETGTDGLGAADAGFDPYSALQNQYGTIEPGENPARTVDVPKKSSDTEKVSQTVRTILEAGATPDLAVPTIEELTARGEFSYKVHSDKAAIADAAAAITDKGWDSSLEKWFREVRSGNVSKANTAMGWALYNNAANSRNIPTAMKILEAMVGHQRNAAQAVQATRILKKLSPEAQLYGVQRSVESLQEELNEQYGDEKSPKLKIDEALAAKLLAARDQAERDEALKDIYRDIGRQMPSRFLDKWNAWRYLAMLGNPRTHVRNIVGNAGFAPVVAVKDLTATVIEAAVSRVSGGKLARTKGAVSAGKTDRALLSAGWSDYANVQEAALGGGKYNDLANANKYVEEGRTIFRSRAAKPVEWARKKNGLVLDVEDAWFSQPHYAYALAQFCKANGITAAQIAQGDPIVLAKARAYAVQEAQKATYRDTNALSTAISDLGRYRGKNPAKRAISTALEGILPFRKTPANILARGVEYSPLGLLKSLSYDVGQVREGKMSGAEAIDHVSAGLTGTGLLLLGVWVASQGLIRGAGSGDDDKRKFEELQGHQAYALELGSNSVTLDWLAPEVLPLLIGVNLWEQTQGEEEPLTLSAMLTAVGNVTEPLLEMSCLQSLNDVFDAVGYAKDDGLNGLTSALASAATSYVTQAFPTLFGQIERILETQRETTYTEKNAFLTPDMQYTLGRISGKTPGEYRQIPYIDAWGRTEGSGSVGERAFSNLLNPAYTSRAGSSPMEEELLRLYGVTGEAGVFPARAEKSFTVNGERKDLTAAEYVQFAEVKGQTARKLLEDLTDSSIYKAMSDDEKTEAVLDAYKLANQTAKAAVSGYAGEKWAANAREAAEKYGIGEDVFVSLRTRTGNVRSLQYANQRDADGKPVTIPNSKSLLIMQEVYNTPGLTERQRQALFGYLGVGKSVRHYNKTLVREKLAEMRKLAK